MNKLIAFLKDFYNQNRKVILWCSLPLVLFPLAVTSIWLCFYIVRKTDKALWIKVVSVTGCVIWALNNLLHKVIILTVLIAGLNINLHNEEPDKSYLEFWEAKSIEERNALLPREKLQDMTGILFPEYDVKVVWEPEFSQASFSTWELELKQNFTKDHLESLCDDNVLEYCEYNDAYYSTDTDNFQFSVMIKGTKVLIYDDIYYNNLIKQRTKEVSTEAITATK